jgi:hypothetical protein
MEINKVEISSESQSNVPGKGLSLLYKILRI